MLKPFIKATKNSLNRRLKPLISKPLLIAAGMILTTTMVHAARDDFKHPIEIDSTSQHIDLKENTTVFNGNVSVVQGSLSIRADFMKVSGQDKKGQEIYIAKGSPAIYRQTLDDGKPIVAQARNIRYDVASRSLILTGQAQLKQNDSLVASETIRYNLDSQTLQAEGADGKPVKSVFNTQADEDVASQKDHKTP